MKLSKYKDEYHEFSKLASDSLRTAAFSGIAVVWVFRNADAATPSVPKALLIPLGLFVLALTSDVLQYVIATFTWGHFYAEHEAKLNKPTDDPDLSHSPSAKRPIEWCFRIKVFCVLAGFASLLVFLISVW